MFHYLRQNIYMKKTIFSLGLTLVLLSFFSCGKKQTCECVYKDNGKETNRTQNQINEGSEDKNKESCDQGDNVSQTTLSNGTTSTTSIECEIID